MDLKLRTLRSRPPSPALRPRPFSRAELEKRAAILACARDLMVYRGPMPITVGTIAGVLACAPSTIRRLVGDQVEILTELIDTHLDMLAQAVDQTPAQPDQPRLRRAACYQAARTPEGRMRPAHLLFTRDLILLPPPIRAKLEEKWETLLARLAPPELTGMLRAFIDNPELDIDMLEAFLASQSAPDTRPDAARIAPEASTAPARTGPRLPSASGVRGAESPAPYQTPVRH